MNWYVPALRDNQRTADTLLNGLRQKLSVLYPDLDLNILAASAPILMFGTLAPTLTDDDVELIFEHIQPGAASKLEEYAADLTPLDQGRRPYEAGYEAAEQFWEDWSGEIDLRQKGRVDVAGIVKSFGVTVTRVKFSDSGLRGAALAGRNLHPVIFINAANSYNREPAGARFTMAHELCHLLYDRHYGREVGVASGPWAPQRVEQRANAFAAMLLMPGELIEKYLSEGESRNWSLEFVENMADELGVGWLALVEHLYNQGAINLDNRERLKEERWDGPGA